jgi:putative oxidoreductase
MAVAYFMVHIKMSIWPLLNGGEITVLYAFIYLWLSAAGAGRWSLDHAMERKS